MTRKNFISLIRKHIHISITILLLFLVASCASSKKSGKEPFIKRNYNDITARDNGFFNARESMKVNEKLLSDGQTDDYNTILPIYKYGSKEQAQATYAAMDDIKKRAGIAIQLHTKSKWVDDCYLLIGKSYFLKQDFDSALITFQYIILEYSDLIKKNPKGKASITKPDADGELTFLEKLKHQPINNDAALWVAKTYIAAGEYSKATTVISLIKARENFPVELKGQLYATEAYAYISQNEYAKAIDPLKMAIEHTDGKSLRSRYSFILSQLYNATGDNSNAIEQLKNVLALKPDYTMDFYAKLNMAKYMMSNYGVSGGGTIASLQTLLKDEKYKEFYGLIYYTLAEIAFADKDKETGIADLILSVQNSDVDVNQKTNSYLRLADIYFDDQNYKTAYAYYDSTLAGLNKNNERYSEITSRKEGLKKLVDQLAIIETEKQLQEWSKLSDYELDNVLTDLLQKADEADSTKQEFLNDNKPVVQNTASGDGSEFYFYNTSLKARGFTEFKKNWGGTKLEDNWRRSDKSTHSDEEQTDQSDSTSESETINLDDKSIDKEKIIASIPKTPEQIAASNSKIASAFYHVGVIYKDDFKNNPKAITAFLDNITNYPSNDFELQSYYQLYITYDIVANQDMYKNLILTKYPSSTFAKIILDPDYLKKISDKNAAVKEYYTSTYTYYENDSLDIVLNRCAAVDTLYKENPYKPKFVMLEALVLSKRDSVDLFKKSLQDIVLKYPTDEVGTKAQQILDYIRRGSTIDDAAKTAAVVYTFKPDDEHYVVIILNSTGKESITLKNQVANFNTENYSSNNLKISSLLLGKDKTIILIKSFPDTSHAMDYYTHVDKSADVFKDLNKDDMTLLVVSKSNYIQFYKAKDVDGYEQFFQEYYLKDN